MNEKDEGRGWKNVQYPKKEASSSAQRAELTPACLEGSGWRSKCSSGTEAGVDEMHLF